MSRADLPALTIADLQSRLRRKEISPRNVLESVRARIDAVESKIDAYLSIDFEAALKEAEKADVDLPLGGVPIAVKTSLTSSASRAPAARRFWEIIDRPTTRQ